MRGSGGAARGTGRDRARDPMLSKTLGSQEYVALRRRGTGWPDGRITKPVRARAIASELHVLRTMLLWATRVRQAEGSWLLRDYPLRGLKLPREEDVRRPIATHERFLKPRGRRSVHWPEQLTRKGDASDGFALSSPSSLPRQPAHESAQFAGSDGPTSRIAHHAFVGGRSSIRKVGSDLSRFRRAYFKNCGDSRRS
jgi:hypothetical protein